MPEHQDELPVKNLKSLLQQSLGDQIQIQSTDWKHLTDPGENFGSLILAIDVTVSRGSKTDILHTVAKLPPPSPFLLKLFDSPVTFGKELTFYKDLTPAFLHLQRENGIPEPESSWLGPQYFGGRMSLKGDVGEFDDQASIILENLNHSGYKMIDRLIGLNKQQTEFAVKQLAQLHAIAIAMRKTDPKQFRELVTSAIGRQVNETAKQCVGDMIKKSLEDLSTLPEAKAYMDVVKQTIEDARKMAESQAMARDETWLTVVHNDFWVNNMMFKFNETEDVVDMKIVDFQLYAYDYGAKDLIFFLISSLRNDIVEDIFNDMVHLYYDSFIAYLRKLNVSVKEYTRADFIDLVEKCAPLKLAQCLMMTQVIKSLRGCAPKMEEIDNKESFLQIGGGEAYYDKLRQVLNIFRNRGWLGKNSV